MLNQEKSLKEMLEEVLQRLDVIEMKISSVPPVYPTPVMDLNSRKCSKCGMIWKGVMGYACPSQDCPVQSKGLFS